MSESENAANCRFLNALRAYLGFRPLYQDGRSAEPGYSGRDDRTDVALRWMEGLHGWTSLAQQRGGRVLPHGRST